jgi:hypothetical protein
VFNESIESLFIQVKKSEIGCEQDVIIGIIYRPPDTDIRHFNDILLNIFEMIHFENNQVYIMGDININLLNSESHLPTSEFIDMLFSRSLFPLITKPTRIQGQSATLIDNIFCNILDARSRKNGILITEISDHFPVFTVSNTVLPEKIAPQTRYRVYSQNNLNTFVRKLNVLDWNTVLNNHNCKEAYSVFHNKFSHIYNECFPIRIGKLGYKSRKPWLGLALKNSIKRNNKLYYLFKRYPSEENELRYKQYKKLLNRCIKEAEREHYRYLFETYKFNLKKSWQVIKEVINKQKNLGSSHEFTINGKNISNGKLIAESFNNYFINIGRTLSQKIAPSSQHPLSFMNTINAAHSIFMEPTNELEIKQIITLLRTSSPGYDGICAKVIKNTYTCYIDILVHLVNLMLNQGKFPNELKIARVIPVFKSGDPSSISNYRPISVLPFFSKVFEKVIYKRLVNFIDHNQIFYKYQFGFREGHNTTLALFTLTDKIIEGFNEGKYTLGIYLDYRKAFDTVNHDILLQKLHKYGIRGTAHHLICDYLTNRSQFVNYNHTTSNESFINCGVPQGSILGPILFLLYINDIYLVSPSTFSILFADDSNFFMQGKDISSLTYNFNTELINLKKWTDANKLSLNIEKTHSMLFSPIKRHSPPILNVKIDNQVITEVKTTKFLGFIIDNNLTWQAHAKYISKKIAKGIGIICRARNKLSKSTLKTLYFSFIYPYLTYGIEIWGSMNKTYIQHIMILQKRVVRIISYSSFRAHTDPLFVSLNLLNMTNLYVYSLSIFMYKVINGKLPNHISKSFHRNHHFHHHSTRHSHLFHVPLYRSSKLQRSARYKAVYHWNRIEKNIVCNCSLSTFKCNVRKFLISNLLSQ